MKVSEELTRFINVLGATIVGALVTFLSMLLIAKGLSFGGGGVFYMFIFVVATAASYPLVRRLTALQPFIKIIAGILGVALIAVFVANWRMLGAEDPGVPLVIAAMFLGIGYWITGIKKDNGAGKDNSHGPAT